METPKQEGKYATGQVRDFWCINSLIWRERCDSAVLSETSQHRQKTLISLLFKIRDERALCPMVHLLLIIA